MSSIPQIPPPVKRGHTDRICKHCGQQYTTRLSNKRVYCSPACHYADTLQPVAHQCRNCGVAFITKPSKNGFYCSKACQNTHRRRPVAERFAALVEKTETCWLWQGVRDRRQYGCLSIPGRAAHYMLAHRYAWELAYGAIPPGMLVCHRCDNPPCVRPDHLFLGTNADNVADMMAKGRNNRGEQHPTARYTTAQILAIRARYAAGEISLAQLAREYEISSAYIHAIIHRKVWRHI